MACIKPDGTLTRPGRAMINAMLQPATLEQVSRNSGLPLYRVRSVIRELLDAGLAEAGGDLYTATGTGIKKLEE